MAVILKSACSPVVASTTPVRLARRPASNDLQFGEGLLGTDTVLDVRPADEYAAGHIPGALNVTVSELERVPPSLAPDTEVVAYCRGPNCIYARQAISALKKTGPERAPNGRRSAGMAGGWTECGDSLVWLNGADLQSHQFFRAYPQEAIVGRMAALEMFNCCGEDRPIDCSGPKTALIRDLTGPSAASPTDRAGGSCARRKARPAGLRR